ncbi:MAG: DsbA family oxidoreductase, partial [Nocardioidaceae bacterium]
MKVEIWSDVVCPWCHVGKRRFEAALDRFDQAADVEVVWRSFELDPGAASATSADDGPDYADRLAAKYGTDRAGAEGFMATMTQAAAAEGLDFRLDRAVRSSSFDAHQVIHLAAARGLQDVVKERLLTAYLTEGLPIGDVATLVRLAVESGLRADEVEGVLSRREYADAVRADEAEAHALGITGVPFFVVDRRYGVSGAQPAEQLLAVLERAWRERSPLTVVGAGSADGSAAGSA